MGFSVGIDTGGTFSDIVVMNDMGEMFNWKVSTASGYRKAVIEGLTGLARGMGLTVDEFLQNTERFIYSTTVATNSVIQRENDGRTGCIVSNGFRDTLFIRRGIRKTIWDCQEPYFPPFVRRAHIREVRERVDAGGKVLIVEHRHRAARPLEDLANLLEEAPPDHLGVDAGAHADQHDPPDGPDLRVGEGHIRQADIRRVERDLGPDRVRQRLRLLIDLLLHEVLIGTLARRQLIERHHHHLFGQA
ncbi:MAG: hypothetical protein K6U74_18440, partial [Firmicutes bacterium]|nr:hypothetical protein [Bacillota bacterium]